MSNIIIKDTSLCAIVRDEIINPAGGIVDFIDSTMPFLEAGVVVDTGSIDGTREALEELALKYKNLKVYYRKFDNYEYSRNFSLQEVKTEMAFVLDADERLTTTDFKGLKEFIEENKRYAGYNFFFIDVYPDKELSRKLGDFHNPRLFNIDKKTKYFGYVYENLQYNGEAFWREQLTKCVPQIIKHFCPKEDILNRKEKEWYGELQSTYWTQSGAVFTPEVSLTNLPFFKALKKYNPRRVEYQCGLEEEQIDDGNCRRTSKIQKIYNLFKSLFNKC